MIDPTWDSGTAALDILPALAVVAAAWVIGWLIWRHRHTIIRAVIGLVVTGLMWAHLREKAHECMGGGGSDG